MARPVAGPLLCLICSRQFLQSLRIGTGLTLQITFTIIHDIQIFFPWPAVSNNDALAVAEETVKVRCVATYRCPHNNFDSTVYLFMTPSFIHHSTLQIKHTARTWCTPLRRANWVCTPPTQLRLQPQAPLSKYVMLCPCTNSSSFWHPLIHVVS